MINEMIEYDGTSICFESPHRIIKTLLAINEIEKTIDISITREITKKFEEVLRGNPLSLLNHFKKKPPKGEMILLIE